MFTIFDHKVTLCTIFSVFWTKPNVDLTPRALTLTQSYTPQKKDTNFLKPYLRLPRVKYYTQKFSRSSDFCVKVRNFWRAYISKVRRYIKNLKPLSNRAQKVGFGNTKSDPGVVAIHAYKKSRVYYQNPFTFEPPKIPTMI